MRVGIAIEETWSFFNEIYAELALHHQVNQFTRRTLEPWFFRERVNRYLFHRDLNSLLRNNQVVFFEWASELLAAASKMPKTCGIVTRLHRYDMYRWADQIEWEVVDKIILVSEAKHREYAAQFPQYASKVVVIPEGTSADKFKFHPKPFTGDIGILCHLTPRKRVYELILEFYELVKTGDGQEADSFHLHIGGGKHILHGDYYNAMHTLVKRLGLEAKVTFYDNVPDPQNWYNGIDIFISNSYSEGLQLAPMEAMASGCYTLSHRWEGADELLPEGNLFFTGTELRQLILEYKDAPEAEKLRRREALRAIVCDKFDINQIKVQICQLVEEVGRAWSLPL
jgi:glycosyltransferase involved in cell wall biosynthesis